MDIPFSALNAPGPLLRRGNSSMNVTSNSTSNSTQHLIGELILENSLQIRTSTMLTAGFNVAAAMMMIISIVYDAWRWDRRRIRARPQWRPRHTFSFLNKIHTAEVFPLVLSTAIVMQGLIFIGIQGTGLQDIIVGGCKAASQIVWPGVWIVANVLLVFGLETAARGFQRKRFAPRGRWNTPICWSIVGVMFIFTWIPSKVRPPKRDKCLASLIWWAAPWSHLAILLNSITIVVYVGTALAIGLQLFRSVKIRREDRIAASRMVYYLGIGIVLMSFVLPFWVDVVRIKPSGHRSQMAAIALNLFGLVNGFLHLLLRSNADLLAIRPLQAPWAKKRALRLFGSSDLDIGTHIATPVALEHSGSLHRLVGSSDEKRDIESRGRLFSPGSQFTPREKSPRVPKTLPPSPLRQLPTSVPFRHSRKKSNYSLFPAPKSESKRVASSVYGDNDQEVVLRPPRPLFFRRHRRDSSEISSATVQIGLRLSNLAMPLAAHELSPTRSSVIRFPIHSPTQQSSGRTSSPLVQHRSQDSSGSLELPIQMKPPTPENQPDPPLDKAGAETQQSRSDTPQRPWPKRSDSLNKGKRRENRQKRERDARMKTLPPIPATPQDTSRPASARPSSIQDEARPSSSQDHGEPSSSQARESTRTENRESSQWPLNSNSMTLLSAKKYQPDRSWI